jgi:hypothetical protein
LAQSQALDFHYDELLIQNIKSYVESAKSPIRANQSHDTIPLVSTQSLIDRETTNHNQIEKLIA